MSNRVNQVRQNKETLAKPKGGVPILRVNNITKTFIAGGQQLPVLKGISMSVNKGDFAIIFGPSGCGKSTLLHAILGLEAPSSGNVYLDETDLYSMSEDEIVTHRKDRIGVVFQQSVWVKSLNVMENVSFPNLLRGMEKTEAEGVALKVLTELRLDGWAKHHPNELSSGQQQRVSLARALTIDPLVIVADEPTGNLDTVTGDELMALLFQLNQEQGKTILMVTHDLEYLRYANKLFHVIDGLIVEEIEGEAIGKMSKNLKNKKGTRTKVTVRDSNYLKKEGDKYVD
jgi:putative ABC transport system ATP-binding protein